MEIDYAKMTAKMHEIVAREGPPVDAEARGKLWEAAAKELEADADKGQKCVDCPGEGCKSCGMGVPVVDIAPAPLGGATSFDDADKFDEADAVESYVMRLEGRFRRIVDNIFEMDTGLGEKVTKVKAAASDMETRLGKPPEPDNFFGRVKEKLGTALGLGDKATKREDGKDFPASAYAYVPDVAKPSTWKLRLTRTPGGGPDAGIVGAAVAALGKGFRGQKVQIPAADLGTVKAKVRSAWRKANPGKKSEDIPAAIKEMAGAFRAFKDAKGNWRWMTLTSNIWRDRDGEILSGAAHEANVAYTDRTKEMPDLRLWHVPGSRVGVADWIDFAHGFLLHSGTFDKGMEDVAESLSKEAQGVSHGFYHDKNEESDVYPWYRDFEASILPPNRAANEWTEFTADNTKEVVMGLSEDKRAYLVEHMGEERVVAIEKGLEEKEAELKAGSIDFKEVLAQAIEATPEGGAKPADGDKGGESDSGAKLLEALTKLSDQVEGIAKAQGEQATEIKALQATDDAKIAAKMEPARQPPADGKRPSEDTGNELSIEDAKAQGAEEAIDPESLPDTPGGRALKQIAGNRGGG